MNNSSVRGDEHFLRGLWDSHQTAEDDNRSTSTTLKNTEKKVKKSAEPTLRRTSRARKPSRRLREIMRDKRETAVDKRVIGKKRTHLERDDLEDSETSEENKRQSVITDKDHLHHFPIIGSDINEIMNSLSDQKMDIKKLSKNDIARLEVAIALSNHTGVYPGLRISSLGEALGNGAFLDPANPSLRAGTILGIYSGEYKLYQIDHLGDVDLSYAFELTEIISLDEDEHLKFFGSLDTYTDDGDYVIYSDALKKGNWTRNINHGGEHANCTAELVRYSTRNEEDKQVEHWVVLVKTSKKIKPGEQLLFDYGANYWKKYGFVPTSMKPSTYTLSEDGRVHSL